MNCEQLEYIVFVASERSISKAAEKLHISTSALSQSITQLEKELDITIFNRSRKGTIPTPEGYIVLTRAINILSNIKELKAELDSHKTNKKSHLKIAVAPTFLYVLKKAIQEFNHMNCEITIEIEELPSDKILKNFELENFDIGFIVESKDALEKNEKIEYKHLNSEKICIAVGKKSKLYPFELVSPSLLDNEQFVALKEHSNRKISNLTKNNKNKVMTSNKGEFLISMVKDSQSFTILHEFTIKDHPDVLNNVLRIIPIKEQDYLYQDLWAISSKTRGLSNSAKKFIEQVMNLIKA